MEKTTENFTWRQLKEFIAGLTEEQLNKKVPVLIDDESHSVPLMEAFKMENDIYVHKEDRQDGAPLEVLKELWGEDFKEEDYEVGTPKGTPFLYIEYNF